MLHGAHESGTITFMTSSTPLITWEAPEHHHIEKSTDWYWILGIVAIAGSIVSIILGNILFGILILLAAATMVLVARKEPRMISFEVSMNGVRVDRDFYPFSSLESYAIITRDSEEPQLLLKSKHFFMTLIIVPVPDEFVEDVDWIIRSRLPGEQLSEPISHRILEFFGF